MNMLRHSCVKKDIFSETRGTFLILIDNFTLSALCHSNYKNKCFNWSRVCPEETINRYRNSKLPFLVFNFLKLIGNCSI